MQAYALRVIKQCSGAPWVLKCLVFVIFVLFGCGHRFCHFHDLFGAVTGPGFQDVTFSRICTMTYLDFVSIVVSSRWLEKVPHAKLSSAKIDLTQNVCVDVREQLKMNKVSPNLSQLLRFETSPGLAPYYSSCNASICSTTH